LILIEDIDRKELQKANGDVFCEIRRSPDNAFIYVNWIGIQSLETIVMGSNQVLKLMREKECHAILNDNHELVGPWDIAVSWLISKWAPQAKALGLRYYAHILSHGIFGKRSYEKLMPDLKLYFKVKSFEDEELAEQWLRLRLE
jgi:hypothetical protein